MADETEHLVLVQLREIRVKLEALDRLENRMEKIEKGFETVRF